MSSVRPTVRQLEYVVAVADHLSFSRAADACGVSQPALSTQVREVEQRLGLSLFERGRGGVSIPDHARPVLDAARRAIRAVDDVVDAAVDLRGELVGPVRVGVIPTMAPYLLPTLVRELRRRHPRAEPVLTEERTDDLVRRIELGELDVGLLAAPVPGEGLEVVDVAVDEFHLAMPEDHPFAGHGPLPSGVLAGLPVLLLEDGHCLRDQAIEACASVGATAEGAIQGTSLTTLCQMVSAGSGVTLVPASALDVESRPGSGLVTRPLRDPRPNRVVVLAWRETSPLAPLYRSFAEAIAPALQAECPTD
ncbi:MAG TPA: LysR substrate-binding domain-containing protein [Acidimicrobiales bacterium]|nr:LysR substrate-binding domain-containing protein [Acidimicrobiales bacterium]